MIQFDEHMFEMGLFNHQLVGYTNMTLENHDFQCRTYIFIHGGFSIVMLAFRGGNNLPSWFRSLRLQWEAHSFEVSNEKPMYILASYVKSIS